MLVLTMEFNSMLENSLRECRDRPELSVSCECAPSVHGPEVSCTGVPRVHTALRACCCPGHSPCLGCAPPGHPNPLPHPAPRPAPRSDVVSLTFQKLTSPRTLLVLDSYHGVCVFLTHCTTTQPSVLSCFVCPKLCDFYCVILCHGVTFRNTNITIQHNQAQMTRHSTETHRRHVTAQPAELCAHAHVSVATSLNPSNDLTE